MEAEAGDTGHNIGHVNIDRDVGQKAPGADSIYPRVLKEVKGEVVDALVAIFQEYIETGVVTEDFKCANVVPIYKKESHNDAGNYRPISLTSVVGKLLESVIRDALQKHLEDNNLIKNTQHGFRRGRSCLTNLLEFFEVITKWVDGGSSVDILLLDLAKAFDKVSHSKLLQKLRNKDVAGNLLRWIENWLTDRKQWLVINGEHSDWLGVNSGVPQGSVLRPLLFLVYIDDLEEGILSKLSKFAVDTKVAGIVDSLEQSQELQMDLSRLGDWAQKWDMEFNVDKCKVVHIGTKNSGVEYTMYGKKLQVVTQDRDLGIVVEDILKPTAQCVAACRKGNSILGMMRRGLESRSR